MNPFTAIPAEVRKWLYMAYGLAGLVFGATAAYVTALGQEIPDWTQGGSAVLVVVGTALGFTAAANVSAQADKPDHPNAPYTGGH